MVFQDILESTNVTALITCMTVSIVFVMARTVARWYKGTWYQTEDFLCWFALVCFITMCALYLTVLKPLYTSQAVGAGRIPPPPDILDQVRFLMGRFYAIQLLFWLSLWSVKFSLLWMFRRLVEGLPNYKRFWLGIVIFTALAFIGCEISQILSCDGGMKAYFTPGACQGPGDARRQIGSLYYSLAVDVSTDLLIMSIPVRLLWNLQISLIEKLSIGVAFIFGIMTIVAAIVRAVSLNTAASKGVIPISWLILWASIEGLIAIIVNCLPTFAIFFRGRFVAHRTAYGSKSAGYAQHSSSNKPQSKPRSRAFVDDIPLNDVEQDADSSRQRFRQRAEGGDHKTTVLATPGKPWEGGLGNRNDPDSSSQESIMGMTPDHMEFRNGVFVTRTVDVSR